jgi:nitroreductase
MDLTEAIHGRRAVREYTSASVDQALLRRLIEAAIQAPSALNRQPWLFTIISDQHLLAEISEKSKAYLLATLSNGSLDQLRKMLEDPDFHLFYHAPSLIVISASQAGAPWAVEDCSLAAENLMLAAYASGLGTCWIGLAQAWLGTAKGKTALQLGHDDAVPVAPIIVGYPKVQPGPVPRREPIIHWIG